MIENLRARVVIIIFVLLSAVLYVLPNFVQLPEGWWFTKDKIVYGLDIQGGTYLVMGVDVKGVIDEKIARISRSISGDLTAKAIPFESVRVDPAEREHVLVKLKSEGDIESFKKYLESSYSGVLQVLRASGTELTVSYYDVEVDEFKKQIVNQSIGVLRNRIDEFGVAEPLIAAQGTDRIIVQLPGIKDSARAKELINRTAKLDFRIVSEEMKDAQLVSLVDEAEKKSGYALGKDGMRYSAYVKRINQDIKDKLPAGTIVAFEKLENVTNLEAGKRPLLLRTDTDLSGDQLEDASVAPGQYGEPEVIFRFDVEGRRKFAEITGANVNKRMAIVLDEVVQSAPVIQGKIDSDSARITLHRRDYKEAMAEATLTATTLRAGALPAALTQLEERTIGPSLGADSVAKGRMASIVGCILIFLFMAFYYRGLGLVADLALLVNFLLTLAILTSLGTTLTLPGIAALALTIGMSVDANVIVFERIKEEARKGASAKVAIREGFANAFSAIFDANVTSIATSVVLLYYGTGPVKGFAVTLIAGVVTSMFSAIFFSRTILELLATRINIKKLASVN